MGAGQPEGRVSGGPNPTRELTSDEKFTWGTCTVCFAKHGQPCDPSRVSFGQKIDGTKLERGEGAHAVRLQAAPDVVALVPLKKKAKN